MEGSRAAANKTATKGRSLFNFVRFFHNKNSGSDYPGADNAAFSFKYRM